MDELSPADDIIAKQTAALEDLMAYYDNLHRVDLVCLDPDAYFDHQLDLKPFKEPKDKSRQRAEKDAGITLGLRAKALFPWSTESKAELEKRTGQAEALQREYEEEHARDVEEERAFYQQQQERHNQRVAARRDGFLSGDPGEVMAYFGQVLCSDDFTLEFDLDWRGRRYESCAEPLEYDPNKGELVVRYRIPDAEEVCTIDSFVDNKKEQAVEAKGLPAKKASERRMRILHTILIRTSAAVFCSDPYDLVRSLAIVGFLDFYDPAYGRRRIVDAIMTTVAKEQFRQVDLEQADPEALFGRLYKTKASAGLYTKKPYELKPVERPKGD